MTLSTQKYEKRKELKKENEEKKEFAKNKYQDVQLKSHYTKKIKNNVEKYSDNKVSK